MTTTPESLDSYLTGRWQRGEGIETILVDPVSGEALATASAKGLDLRAALEFARKGYRIRVNSIHPGVIDTDMGAATFAARAERMGTNDIEAARRQATSWHPIGRLGTAADIAKAIVFLASDDAGFITGSGLVADGGWTAQ